MKRGFIYVVKVIDEPIVKIGFTIREPEARFSMLRSHNHCELEIKCCFRGTLEMEEKIHKRFESLRIRGEWFLLNTELRKFIRSKGTAQITFGEPTAVFCFNCKWTGVRRIVNKCPSCGHWHPKITPRRPRPVRSNAKDPKNRWGHHDYEA